VNPFNPNLDLSNNFQNNQNNQNNQNFGPINNPSNVNTISHFKIRNKAATSMCLTIHSSSNKVGLKKCQAYSSAKQEWRMNPKTAYIHSANDETKCLFPRIESDDPLINKTAKRSRLIVKTCPYFSEAIFQWKFANGGVLINRKKDRDGTPLAVQASRGVKQVGYKEEVLLIPTLSRYSNVDKFFQWLTIPI
jgi:hypothetical protein